MQYDLYVVTDETLSGGLSHSRIAELAVEGGADIIQLREKKKTDLELYEIGREIREITERKGACFIINDRIDIALACRADGVHLGQGDLPLSFVRAFAPAPFIIGISVGSVEEATNAEKEGADYVAVSPVFSTGSKDDAGPGLGLQMVRDIRAAVRIPVVAIGGIHMGNAPEIIKAGADGVAVISAVVNSPDIRAAAQSLRTIIKKAKRELQD